jgi:transcriptional regulator with XRE-family HTH domain
MTEAFSREQLRAARGSLNWSIAQTADAAGLDPASIEAFEAGDLALPADAMSTIRTAFGRHDVYFERGPTGWESLSWRSRRGFGAVGESVSQVISELADRRRSRGRDAS